MNRKRRSWLPLWALVAMAMLGLGGLFGSAGCNHNDDRTTFGDAFNSLGDAFSDWSDHVF